MTACIHMICGIAGAGKTTLAKQLATERDARRFCPDEWVLALLDRPDNVAERDRLRTPVEHLQLAEALALARRGHEAILENGFWTAADRRWYREQIQQADIPVTLHFLDVPSEELKRRIAARNENLPPGTFTIPLADLVDYIRWFEPPSASEAGMFDGFRYHGAST